MTIKLALLKSGEEVISDIKEFRDPDDNLVSYLFKSPHYVKLSSSQVLVEGVEQTKKTETSTKKSNSIADKSSSVKKKSPSVSKKPTERIIKHNKDINTKRQKDKKTKRHKT